MKEFRSAVLALMGWLYRTFLAKHLGVIAFDKKGTYVGAHWTTLTDKFAIAGRTHPHMLAFEYDNPPPPVLPDEADCKTVWCERCRCFHKPFTQQDWDRHVNDASKAIAEHVDRQLLDAIQKQKGSIWARR